MKSKLNSLLQPEIVQAKKSAGGFTPSWTRRQFLRSAGRAATVGALAALDVARFAHAEGSGTLRLGLVGCGGRGTDATKNALATGTDVKLVAMADLFEERVFGCLVNLGTSPSSQVQVPKENQFVGFDAIDQLLAAKVDGVILATPPGFRPLHFEKAVQAGVHCFLEKEVAVDAPGIRQIRAANKIAQQKRLSAVVGLQDRFDKSNQELMDQIAKGMIGPVIRLKAGLHWKGMPRKFQRRAEEEKQGRRFSEMEYQIRNWFFFTWLSGDLIAEVLVHNIDDCLWAIGSLPKSVRGSAERREHTQSDCGNVSDSLSVKYQFGGGVELAAEIACLASSDGRWYTNIEGERGVATTPGLIVDRQGNELWSFKGNKINKYQEEFNQWCDSIRNGRVLNTVESAADSTLAAIMGRTAAYTGREVTWDEMLNSKETFFTGNPRSFLDDPPELPDKYGDYLFPPHGRST